MKMVVAYIQSRAREFQEFLPINQVLERSFLDYDGIQQYSLLMDQAIALSKSRMLYLEKIISSLPEAMVIINRYDEVLLSNSEFKNIKDTRMGTRKNIQSIIMAWGCSFNLIQQLRENPDITHALDIEVEKGNIRNFRVHIVDLTLDNSEVLWMINFIDVTAILSAQAERNRTLQFLSHDMRTPLAVIISLSTKSNKQLANLNTPDLSHKIIFYSHKVLALIDDFILSVSVEEVTHQVQVVLLETLVDDAVYQVKPLAEERNMSISWNEDVEPSFISVNTRLIIRVLVNLLSNAIRYGEAGSKIVINMAMITDDQGKSLVECAVTNYVGAINETDEKKQENLGFGLGLDFVQKVVSKHSGSMLRDIPSSAGEVATVSIKLPTV
jgi:signal transduction histidine kinase